MARRPRSRLSKKDPTHSIRRINRYHKDLVLIVKRFRVEVRAALTGEVKALEVKKIPVVASEMMKQNVIRAKAEMDIRGELVIKHSIPEAYRAGATFGNTQLVMPAPARLDELTRIGVLVEKNKTIFSGISEDMSSKTLRVISNGLIEEKPVYQIADEIDAILEIGINRATAMARTEIMYAVNTGAVDRYVAAGVEEVEWVAAMDDQMCEDCEDLDGKTWPIGEAPACPAHPNCRCALVPVVV